ncbi:MAG: diphosphomevalonate decarboxylase [Myxococcota bacterium]
MKQRATAKARANIALAKYWGKSDVGLNLPAVPSISLTLDGLVTETTVTFDDALASDEVALDGRPATASETGRVVDMLARVRDLAGIDTFAKVRTRNRFPTAAGLASSASGFAALAAASTTAAGLRLSDKKLSALARQSSASAARSIFGGFSELPAGKPGNAALAARPLHGEDWWDVRLVVAKAAKGPKKVGSTEGMERSRRTSPIYDAWVEESVALTRTIKRALKKRDLDVLGAAMEQSTFSFHACAMSSKPAILYWQPATMAALRTVESLREKGISAWATMDAGPHVKVLCEAKDASRVQRALRKTEGILGTIVAKPGARLEVRA